MTKVSQHQRQSVLDTTQQNQYQQDDNDGPDQTHAAMTVTIAIAPETSAKPAEQQNDQDNEEDRSE
jgi:hypothetical protein